jgi:hypothetical protein
MERARLPLTVILLIFSLSATAEPEMTFPGKQWQEAKPESQGVDSAKLDEAISYLRHSNKT